MMERDITVNDVNDFKAMMFQLDYELALHGALSIPLDTFLNRVSKMIMEYERRAAANG